MLGSRSLTCPDSLRYFASTRVFGKRSKRVQRAVSQASFAQFYFQPVGEVALGCAVRGAVSE